MRFAALFLVLLCVPARAQNAITIRVADADKKPLAGATVALRIWGEPPFREETLKAGDDGTIKFDLAAPLDAKKPVGSVTVHAPGFALQSHAIDAVTIDFALQAGAVWRGKVVDEAGKPLGGARVRVTATWPKGASDDRSEMALVTGDALETLYTATADAAGNFALGDVPAQGKISYGAQAPGYAAAGGYSVRVEKLAKIALVLGAAFKGRLLGLDGRPLAGVRVFAQGTENYEGYGEAKTDEKGDYLIESLSLGSYNVNFEAPEEAAYIVPALANVAVLAPATQQLPQSQAVEGVVVRGVVRDQATKAPLAGARIGVYGPHRPDSGAAITSSRVTQADGRFSLRVVPGNNRFYPASLPEFYLRDNASQTLEVDAKTPEITFNLQKAPILTGTIVNEKNQPIAAQLRVWGGFEAAIKSDAQGRWSFKPQQLGKIEIGGGENENGYFEITSGAPLTAPSKQPNVIHVRLKPWQILGGRVVAPDGTPRAGVEVKASFYFGAGDGGALLDSDLTATTDDKGVYQFTKIRGGETPGERARGLKVTARAEGYAFVGGGEITPDGKNWRASDIVLSALNRRIQGTTAPGARLTAAGQGAQADADGHFSFKDLPVGEVAVYAALNGSFGKAISADAEPINIELAPLSAQKTDVELGRDAWREVFNESQGKDFYARDWILAQLNAAQGETFAALQASAQEPPTPNHDWSLAAQLEKWAPKLDATNRVALIESVAKGIQDPETRLMAWLDAAIAIGDDAAVSARALREANAVMAGTTSDVDQREYSLYRLAVVTEQARGQAAGAAQLDKAIAVTLKSHGPKNFTKNGYYTAGRDGTLAYMAEIVAQGSAELLRRLLANISPENGDNVAALANAIPVVAQTRGIEAALPLLEELHDLPKPDFAPGDEHSLQNEPQYAFDTTARRLVPLLGAQSPARALELARRIRDAGGRARALANAASFQTPAVAAQLWREAVTLGDVGDAPRFAARAFELDPKLGRELFALARARGENSDTYARGGFWAPYGFYLARADAASARLELEREWSARLASNEGQNLAPIARAMSAANGARALEMARQLPAGKDNFWSLEARRKIGQYLVATPDQRRDWPFDRWGATDTWGPGDEEW